jgi:hypothetical protein
MLRKLRRVARLAARCRLVVVLLLVVAFPADVGGQEWIVAPPPDAERNRRAPRIEKPPEDLFAINGAFLGTFQWVAKSDVARGSVFGAGSLDVAVTVRPTDTMRIFIDVQGLVGQGPDEKLGTLSRLNKNADDLLGRDETVRLMKLILRQSWLEDRILFSVGKLDVEDYFDRNAFAEDEGTQFLAAALLTSPMLQAPLNGPGVALRVSWADWRYGFGVHGLDDVDGDLSGLPFIIAELGRRNLFKLRGHYRWWARVSAVPDARDRVTWGTGVSIDQLVASNLGVFVRAGLSRSQGETRTSYAWSAGVQFTAPWLGGKDTAGIGYSHQQDPDARERLAEVYYRFVLADWLSVIANVQWVLSGPNQVSGGENRNLVVPGLRALLQF